MTGPKRVLIEDWLPIKELGIESRRERAAASALPPLSFLHVWWARRPLAASAGVVLASLMPSWSKGLAAKYPNASQLSSEKKYRAWLLYLVGIWGDPIAGRARIDHANVLGEKLKDNGYGYKMAYKNLPSRNDLELLNEVLTGAWGEAPVVLDPTAGGGSIPFVAARLGIPTVANDLNSVAALVLLAGVKIPIENGREILEELNKWGKLLVSRVRERMLQYFPLPVGERVIAYIFANAVTCPRNGRLVPLMPDKWLCKDAGRESAVKLIIEDEDGTPLDEPRFVVVTKSKVSKIDAAKGTVKRGDGISPYDNLVIDGEYIKEEAQAGRMRQVLYAVATRNAKGDRGFRAPTQTDLDGIRAAEQELGRVRKEWESKGFIPIDEFPLGNDNRPRHYGITTWASMFTSRQLLVHGTFSEEYARIIPEIQKQNSVDSESILIELALLQGKAINWNSRLTSWDVSRQKMRSVFDRHDFAFKWTIAEMEGATELYPWAASQLLDSYSGIVDLLDGGGAQQLSGEEPLKRCVTVTQGSAASMPSIASGSIAHICMDPPYFDNVMYAELADFFYVWEKHTIGRIRPDIFPDAVSDKDNEAVANPSRFTMAGKRKVELAELDYQAKMTAIFAECHRMLRDDGVMTVMFTHKRAEAWDSLGTGLLDAGFTIKTSWPVNTEAEHSLHQANMNSAASTIMLVCRKRPERKSNSKVFLEDIADEVRASARNAVSRFEKDGIDGVDLLLSTYGPTLSVISHHWPVYSSVADDSGRDRLLHPEEALDLAREELVALRRRRLVGHAAQFDSLTDFVLIAWDTFKAREFSFDTARLLALAVGGLDIDELVRAKVVEKSAGKVRILEPYERVRRDSDSNLPGVNINSTSFVHMIDAVDTAVYIATEDGYAAAKRFLDKAGLCENQTFKDAFQALVNAIPRTSVNGEWVVPIAGVLDTLATSHLSDITLPPKNDLVAHQLPTEELFKDV